MSSIGEILERLQMFGEKRNKRSVEKIISHWTLSGPVSA